MTTVEMINQIDLTTEASAKWQVSRAEVAAAIEGPAVASNTNIRSQSLVNLQTRPSWDVCANFNKMSPR